MIQDVYRRVKSLFKQLKRESYSESTERSIFADILKNDKLPQEEKELRRLVDEGNFLMSAGTDAPSQVLTITMFHILRNPDITRRLKEELASAMPDPWADASWSAMEQLKYLVISLAIPIRSNIDDP
jgi:cytochrome P450